MAVFKKNGNWWIDTYINGRRLRRKIGPSKRTAELAEKDLKVRAARGEWLGIEQIKRIIFADFCKEFLGRLTGKAKQTCRNYEVACRVHFIPAFGARFLSDIRHQHVEDYQQERAKEAQYSTVNQELVLLSAIFRSAIARGCLKENAVKHVKPLTVPEKEPPYMTREQVAKLYDATRGWVYTFVAIALNTGLRVSEVCGLQWKDVDMQNRVIKVRNSESFTTKNRRNRILPLNDFLFSVLKKAPRHIKNPHVVFTREGGNRVPQSVRNHFMTALKRAGLPHFRIHDMRHTFGTTLAADGVDVVTIQKLMGHRDIKTTMRYLHAAPDRMRWAVENLQLDGTVRTKNKATAHPGGPYLDTGVQSAQ